MNLSVTLHRLPGTEFSRLDDAYLAIDSARGFCYSLNATAGRAWELMEQPITLAKLCAQMQSEFAVEEESCRTEISVIVTQLRAAGLVKVTDSVS